MSDLRESARNERGSRAPAKGTPAKGPSGARRPEPEELFEILVREQEPRVRAFVSSLVRDPGTVEDLVQESFVVAWRNLDRYDRSLPFGPWLRGIARKLVLAQYRRSGREKLDFLEAEVLTELSNLHAALEQGPGDSLEDQLRSLRACLERLPEHQQEVLQLHYERDLPCAEIGETLGKSREAVKKLLQRARTWLGTCMEQRMDALGVEG